MSTDSDHRKEAYPQPPRQTPVPNPQTSLPHPGRVLDRFFYYVLDVPVTAFRGVIDGVRSKNNLVYYHRKYRRVPYLTECQEGDYLCYYEAEMQWKRDLKVDQEIVKVMKERMGACQQREGQSAMQNCAKEVQQFNEVSKNYQLCYGDLGAHGNARKCLMKQKARMMSAEPHTI